MADDADDFEEFKRGVKRGFVFGTTDPKQLLLLAFRIVGGHRRYPTEDPDFAGWLEQSARAAEANARNRIGAAREALG